MTFRAPTFVAALLLLGCEQPPEPQPFDVHFQIRNDQNEPVAGAKLQLGNRSIGETHANGALQSDVSGAEGDSLEVTVHCPPGFADAESDSPLVLKRTKSLSQEGKSINPITWTAVCPRLSRKIALVVHTNKHQQLPVLVDGKAVAQTDEHGNAHALIDLGIDRTSLDVSIGTAAHGSLKPQNPSRSYSVGRSDELLVFEQSFATATPKPRRAAAPAEKPRHVPYRIR